MVAAKALGGSAWELARLPKGERSFWLYRGLLYNSAQAEAMEQDDVDRGIERMANQHQQMPRRY